MNVLIFIALTRNNKKNRNFILQNMCIKCSIVMYLTEYFNLAVIKYILFKTRDL